MCPTSSIPAARMKVGDDLFLPYGVADSSVAFAFMSVKELLGRMR